MTKHRDLSFDLLRAIGLLSIILAHVSPPSLLFQFRTFDVVMMVCVSTVTYTEYSRPKPYFQYLKGRIKRLLFPAWIYILLLGLIFGAISYATNTPTAYPLKTLLIGIFSLSGVGYLWVIRVFLYNAFINPFIPRLKKYNQVKVFCGVVLSYVLYTIVRDFCMGSKIPYVPTLAEASFISFFAYGIIAVVSYLLYHQTTKILLCSITIISIILLVTIYVDGGFMPNVFKYPPALQYILWGLLVVSLSFFLIRIYPIKTMPSFLTFVSENSLWVYFWHLIPVNFIEHYRELCPQFIVDSWWLKYLLIVIFATFMTYSQNYVIKLVKRKI